jgi:superfamily II DNA or RNA helicase
MALEKYTPRPEQEAAIQEVLSSKRHICRAEVGAGKTLIGVEAVIRSGVQTVLLVSPLNPIRGWRKTFERQGSELPFRQIKTLRNEDKDLGALMMGTPGVYAIGWELFRRHAMWKSFPIDFAIFDEVHRGQNRKSSTHEAMKSVRAEYRLNLSATPWGNRIEGSWAILKSTWPEAYPAFWPFVTKYLTKESDQYSRFKVGPERVPGTVWSSIPSKSYFPSPYQEEPIVHTVEVDLKPAQRKLYAQLEEEGFVWLEDNPLAVELPSTLYLRLMETTLATPSLRYEWRTVPDDPEYEIKRPVRTNEAGVLEEEWEVVYFEDDAKSTKADAVEEVLADLYAEAPVPVLIFTHSEKFATYFTKRLQKKGFDARRFIGGMSPEEREWKLEGFGKEFDILVATIATVGEGTDGLQEVCQNEIWVSVSDNRMLNEQARGRLSRPGQKNKVNRWMILAKNTVETDRQLPRIEKDSMLLEASFTDRKAA